MTPYCRHDVTHWYRPAREIVEAQRALVSGHHQVLAADVDEAGVTFHLAEGQQLLDRALQTAISIQSDDDVMQNIYQLILIEASIQYSPINRSQTARA